MLPVRQPDDGEDAGAGMTNQHDAFGHPLDGKLRCSWCYDREQFTHGEIKREWASEWQMFVPVCRKHSFAPPTAAEHNAYPKGRW